MPTDMSDNEIIQKIRSGGNEELGMVYKKYRTEFLQWIRRDYACSQDDALDIYQRVTIVFYDNIKSGKLQHLVSSVKTYLFGIGKNIALETIRKSSRTSPIDQEQWLTEKLVDDDDSTSDEEMFTRAREALKKLGQPCQELIELFYYQRKSMEEISRMMGYKNSETAKNQKCKCMARLRKLFELEMKNVIPSIS